MIADKDSKPIVIASDAASGRDSHGSSLIPMLVAGLVLITLGAVVLMMFV